MQLRISLVDGPRIQTVSIRASPGTLWSEVAAALPCRLPGGDLVVEYAGASVPLTPHLLVGSPPLIHGATIRPATPGGQLERRAPVRIRVTAGPDVSGSYPVRPGGRLTVGRGPFCDIVVDDPGLSRHHLTVSTTRHGVLVEDASSTNGTSLGGVLLQSPTVWTPGVPLRAGATCLELSPELATMRRGRPDGAGRVVVAPRTRDPEPLEAVSLTTPELTLPTAPTAPAALGWLLPLAVSVLLAVVLSMPTLMLFGLMAPAMSLGGYVGDRRRYRRECTAARAAHQRSLADLSASADQALRAEARVRQERVPDLAQLLEQAHSTGDLVWSRRATPLVCRLGLGLNTTAVTLDGSAQQADHLPLEVDLDGGLVLVGTARVTRALARSVLVQLAVLHAPSELSIELMHPEPSRRTPGHDAAAISASTTGPETSWDWLAWLPHADAPGLGTPRASVSVLDLTSPHPGVSSQPQRPNRLVAVAGGPTSEKPPGSAADQPSDVPCSIPIILCRTVAEAPDAATVVTVTQDRLEISSGRHQLSARPDLLSLPRAVRAARALAGHTTGGAEGESSGLPDQVDLGSIVPVPIDSATLERTWRANPRTTSFLLGMGPTGEIWLDLARDGPHALVAGTTGSGKSELLRTLVTSLALGNRPDELVMVLVDYKGGSAFAEASALPHVVGLITDLDPHLADRALTSLTAELKRRERILAEAGAPDLPAYQALGSEQRLARLVLVIDEFRALAEELPDFLDGLVRIAALGRSLGVHLVLATQRPGGVVSADVRANVNLRIALRVRDGSDSYDVIDSPAAADLPEGIPGRALIRTGASPARLVQVASASSAHRAGGVGAGLRLSVMCVSDVWAPDLHENAGQSGSQSVSQSVSQVVSQVGSQVTDQETTLSCAAGATVRATQLIGAVPPPSPWLPGLPALVTLGELSSGHDDGTQIEVPLMLTDLPAQQRQPVHCWRPLTDGHLGVAGATRSGRSTVARTVLAALLARDSADTHVYAFDLAGALGPLDQSVQVGAVLGARDVVRGRRVIDHLGTLVAHRQQALAAHGLTSLQEQHSTGDDPWPLVLLVIDGWPRFAELYGETDRGRPLEQILQVLREGQAVGVVAVVTGDRSLLVGRIAPLLPEMWALRLSDNSDLLMAGLTRSQVPATMPPGRAVRLRDGVVGQVAVVGADADGAAQVAALTSRLGNGPSTGPPRPTAFRPLPRTVPLDEITGASAGVLLLGVGGDAAEPVGLPLPPSGSMLGVVGPPGSGRTTTLRTLEAAAGTLGWSVVQVSPDHLRDPSTLRSALHQSSDPTHTSSAPTGAHSVLVTVDGIDRFAQTTVEDTLLSWLEEPAPTEGCSGRLLVMTGGPEDFGGFRGLGARVQRERTGIVLQPSAPTDGAALGATVPTGDEPLPGRGVLVVRGVCTALQVAHV